MAKDNKKSSSPNHRKKRPNARLKDEMIYFEGRVVETFPSTVFAVEVLRKNNLPPIIIKANLKTQLKVRRVLIIKGDNVRVEVNPQDMTYDDGTMKGIIVERL